LQLTALPPAGSTPADFPVIITSFEIAIRERKPLSKLHYKYLVVDEGHRLKNNNCLLVQELKKLTADNKLLLTGTPLQNNLAELWSLLNFLLPTVFNNLDDFESWFDFSAMVSSDGTGSDAVSQEILQSVCSVHNVTDLCGSYDGQYGISVIHVSVIGNRYGTGSSRITCTQHSLTDDYCCIASVQVPKRQESI
jgi:hypothetical protein